MARKLHTVIELAKTGVYVQLTHAVVRLVR